MHILSQCRKKGQDLNKAQGALFPSIPPESRPCPSSSAAIMTDYTTGIMPLTQVNKPPFTIEAPGYEKVPGESIPRRHPKSKNGLRDSPAEGVHTVYDIVQRSAKNYPNHQAVGGRKLIEMHKETKKVQKNVDGEVREVDKEWQYFELSPFSFLTYKQYEERVNQLGSGLRKLGLNSEQKLHLFATTR